MTQQGFEALVRRLESYSKQQPQSYQFGVAMLAILGYIYIGLILLLLLALIGVIAFGFVYALEHTESFNLNLFRLGKLLIPFVLGLLSLMGLIFRSLQVHFDAPTGIMLQRVTSPRLFSMLDEVCARLHAPQFHHVLLDSDFNAGVLQVPRLGVFGWQTNYLMLGMPLMLALSPDQFRAVVAHEVGHLSRNHSRFGGWIYRVRRTWFQMLAHLEAAQHGGLSLLLPFFRWYAPYFFAYSFVLARANEYVADRCAAEVCGPEKAAQALTVTELKGRFFEEMLWTTLYEQGQEQPRPPDDLLTPVAAAFHTALAGDFSDRWYAEALEVRTGVVDTHPALRDRLAALGFRGTVGGPMDLPRPPFSLPPPAAENAASVYLGPMLPRYAASVEAEWHEQVDEHWRKAYQTAQVARRRLDELEREVLDRSLSSEEAWERARLVAQFEGDVAATPLLQEFLGRHPNHVPANFLLGKSLLKMKDARGIAFLQQAASDPQARAACYTVIAEFYRRIGKTAEAARYLHLARQPNATQVSAPLARPSS